MEKVWAFGLWGRGMGGSAEAPEATTLRGRWGSLRPLDPARDAGELFKLTHDLRAEETWAEMKVGPFPSEAAFRVHMDEMAADKSRSFFTIVGNQDQQLGWLCLMEAKPEHRTIELGYVTFAPSLRRTTLATEAFYLIMARIFDDLGYDRLEWTCTAENERSQNAARRLGLKYEGTMRHKLILKGRTRDISLYSLIAQEWPSVRAAMQDWLDPANFRDGKQMKALCLSAERTSSNQRSTMLAVSQLR